MRLLNALKINMALSCKGCSNAREPYLMLEQELSKTLRPYSVNLDKIYSQYDQGGFDQWEKVGLPNEEMEMKLQARLARKLHH